MEILHAKLDRNTGTTSGEGDLFQTEDIIPVHWAKEVNEILQYEVARPEEGERLRVVATDQVVIYARCQPGWIEVVEHLLRETAKSGFGRDKSAGLGAFQVMSVEPFDGFAAPPGADGFVSLSSYVPAPDDPRDGFYRLRTKYGKLSEIVPSGYPFKRPLIQMEPGACFFTGGAPQPWYGRLVAGIAPGRPEAVQGCYTLAVAAVFPKPDR